MVEKGGNRQDPTAGPGEFETDKGSVIRNLSPTSQSERS
jgi:hypothetical protein